MKRFITLLLLVAMLVSCGSGSTESKDTSSADNTDSTTEPEVTTESEEAKLPDIDLGGKTVTYWSAAIRSITLTLRNRTETSWTTLSGRHAKI